MITCCNLSDPNCRELLGTNHLLRPFLEEWDGPLPQGFSAIALAKSISLPKALTLGPAVLHAMRQNLRHTSLAGALQVICHIYVPLKLSASDMLCKQHCV